MFILIVSSHSFSQKKKWRGFKLKGTTDSIQGSLDIQPIVFDNINKIPYFYDKKKFNLIRKYNTEKNWEKLYQPLEDYVKRFGIENFYKDTYWLWRYAQITELNGNIEKAKILYRLVLKHHRKEADFKKLSLHYDSLNQNNADNYVPLEYYYELVEYRKEIDTLRPPRGILINMGQEINSEHPDYGPALSLHNNTLLITSKRNQIRRDLDKIVNEDLFFSTRIDGHWQPAKSFKNINTRYNEGSACLSRDGKTLYFARCNSTDGFGNCDLFVAEMQQDSTWGNIKNLGEMVNGPSWDSQPSLSHSEDTLYFASDRIGGFGLSDIYFTYKNKKGEWTKAQNLGPVVNTRGNEVSPFYHPMHSVLYFSSNGHLLNFGDFDIYKSYQVDQRWAEPKNVGPLVNGSGSEYYFTIDSKSKDLFYAKSKKEEIENLDLFSFPLPMGAQPEATALVQGSLLETTTNEPMKGIVSIIDLDSGIEVAPKFLREDGSFSFDLINNKNYLLIIQGDDFFRIEELFYLDGDFEYHRKVDRFSSRIKFESVEFDNGKAELKSEMYGDLNKIVDFMLDNPDFKLKISGHTDSDGSERLNLKLSEDRAKAIMEYITYFGSVEEDRVEAIGYGSSKPIVEEKTDEDKKLNRRVEFEIIRE
ncbi:OmpA family protein [Fulvivirgaceae bacterium BMA10]|uniref:OmpA family protein n=1 Tax=Splendidivirga corallicola TaxID=3051826 RepID=A0ABT8KJD8_9BACT|nr:OmpA family protein [Fulvivirgaceae bacterium BMA10]